MKKIIIFASIILFTLPGFATTYTAKGTFAFTLSSSTMTLTYANSSFDSYPLATSTTSVTVTATALTLISDSVTITFTRDTGEADNITGIWYNSDKNLYLAFARDESSIYSGSFIFSSDSSNVTTTTDTDADVTCFIMDLVKDRWDSIPSTNLGHERPIVKSYEDKECVVVFGNKMGMDYFEIFDARKSGQKWILSNFKNHPFETEFSAGIVAIY